MSNPELRFLYTLAGFPRMAASQVFTDYDRRVCEQIVAHLGWLPDDEDNEYLESVEREIETEENKYPEVYDETRS